MCGVAVGGTESTVVEVDDRMKMNEPFFIIESFCITWFTIELVLRFITCPVHTQFFKNIMNSIDLLSIAPYYVTIATVCCMTSSLFIDLLYIASCYVTTLICILVTCRTSSLFKDLSLMTPYLLHHSNGKYDVTAIYRFTLHTTLLGHHSEM